METLLVILLLLSILALVIGLIKPGIVIRWGAKRTRGRVTLTYGIAIIVFFILIGVTGTSSGKKELIEANNLWMANQHAEAIIKYKSTLDGHYSIIDKSERPTIFQRIIEFEVEKGNTSSARAYIEKALGLNVSLAFNEGPANDLFKAVKHEKEEERQRKLAEQEEARRRELAAQEEARQRKLAEQESKLVEEREKKERGEEKRRLADAEEKEKRRREEEEKRLAKAKEELKASLEMTSIIVKSVLMDKAGIHADVKLEKLKDREVWDYKVIIETTTDSNMTVGQVLFSVIGATAGVSRNTKWRSRYLKVGIGTNCYRLSTKRCRELFKMSQDPKIDSITLFMKTVNSFEKLSIYECL